MPTSSFYKEESGRRLKSARAGRELTLKALSEKTGLEVSRISNYEQGERYMDPDVAHKLARALGVRASWLMVIDDPDTMTSDERVLVEKYRRTDDRGKKSIQGIADTQPEIVPSLNDDKPTSPTFSGKRSKIKEQRRASN